MRSHEPDRSARDLRWAAGALALCFLFGLAMVLNMHPIGDGLWFWYGQALCQHQRLYSELHLNQQPFFILATAVFQRLLGISWLASKVMPVLQLATYCGGLYLVSTFIPWRGWRRGLLLLASFGLAMGTPLYRFDDYHVVTQCAQLYSIYLLLSLWRGLPAHRTIASTALLGLLAGISTSNRLNDGFALFVACAAALWVLLAGRRLLALAVYAASTLVSLLAIVLLTGDTISAWALDSIVHASRLKGGGGTLLDNIVSLPWRVAADAFYGHDVLWFLVHGAVFVAFWRLPRLFGAGARMRHAADWLVAAFLLALAAHSLHNGLIGDGNARIARFGAVMLILLGAGAALRAVRFLARPKDNRAALFILVLIPLGSTFATAMSAGPHPVGLEPDIALLLLLTPFALPWTEPAWLRRGLLALSALIVIAAFPGKVLLPYSWHHFPLQAMFKGKVWYTHPVYGPMYIEQRQLDFMLPLCRAITATRPDSLLSLPFPYPNYFCAIPPWHGYVQTWYDTSGPARIAGLEHDLAVDPPTWIVYQRALDTMRVHEAVFHNGAELPHRALDRQIIGKLQHNQWTAVRRTCFEGADWILIRTSPPIGNEPVGYPGEGDDRSLQCARP